MIHNIKSPNQLYQSHKLRIQLEFLVFPKRPETRNIENLEPFWIFWLLLPNYHGWTLRGVWLLRRLFKKVYKKILWCESWAGFACFNCRETAYFFFVFSLVNSHAKMSATRVSNLLKHCFHNYFLNKLLLYIINKRVLWNIHI